MSNTSKGFGTAPVFFTAISTILGAILFLRFGYAVGNLGMMGVFLIIIVGHLVTIPTALAISEIATNERVKGGGEYYIISRSFGLNIGATIGIALYLSQAISVAFYVIAFTEAFTPLFDWLKTAYDIVLPKQVISIPTLVILAFIIIKKGSDVGVKVLYFVVAALFISLFLFFIGSPIESSSPSSSFADSAISNPQNFFVIFAIIFPAFTGMTAGVGLSGDLKDPKKSIPAGTLIGTISGMIVYFFIVYKLSISAPAEELVADQLIMSRIAVWGAVVIPLGLAASTLSSAIGSILVAPRTLQALSHDKFFPVKGVNSFLRKGTGEMNEPLNGTFVTTAIALVFVILGDVNAVASVITMFFMVTYGSICLISFLHHFGSDPSYRPTFQSRWYLSLLGAILSLWLMFQINAPYAIAALAVITLIYFGVNSYHKERGGLESIFQGAIYQFSRKVQVFLQKSKKKRQGWRPAAVCISKDTFQRDRSIQLLSWISYRYGFGTYIHLLEGYYSKQTKKASEKDLERILNMTADLRGNIFFDTIISPSYTSAIAQTVQLPSSSGMENNMVIFEFDKKEPDNLGQILENLKLVQSGGFDVCILGSSLRNFHSHKGIHVWIRNWDADNTNLMILLSYIILGHPDWKNGHIKIFSICRTGNFEEKSNQLQELVHAGRLPISQKNIEVIELSDNISLKEMINEKSGDAGLTLLGFRDEIVSHEGENYFLGYDNIGDVLFINAMGYKKI